MGALVHEEYFFRPLKSFRSYVRRNRLRLLSVRTDQIVGKLDLVGIVGCGKWGEGSSEWGDGSRKWEKGEGRSIKPGDWGIASGECGHWAVWGITIAECWE